MKIALIYLAAGNSRRFGSNKLFYEIDGKPMYRHLLDRLVRIADRNQEYEMSGLQTGTRNMRST